MEINENILLKLKKIKVCSNVYLMRLIFLFLEKWN